MKMNFSTPTVQVNEDGKFVEVIWSENHSSRFHCKWIRFHCRCEQCIKPFSSTYTIDRTKFSSRFACRQLQIKDGNLLASFNETILSDHVTIIPLNWLINNCNCESCLTTELDRREIKEFSLPNKVQVPVMKSEDVKTKIGMFRCIENVLKVGFCLIEDVPTNNEEVTKFAEHFGYITNTSYGRVWDVKLESKPFNFAHTSRTQTLHQDLASYESEPGIQYLHAYRFDEQVSGGESMIVDLFMAANKLRLDHPKLFDTLTRIPACFTTIDYKRENPLYQQSMKSHIELDYHGRIVAIHWHPGTEGTLRVREEDMEIYYEAHNAFQNILNNVEHQFIHRLQPGQLLMMNNHRVAHSRKGFQLNGGVRCLQGAYTSLDELKSTYMVLANQLNIEAVPMKVGNRSSF